MRILFVEDLKHLQKPVVKALKASGYAVDASVNGEEGLWMAQSYDYDVLILDIMLPGMTGLEILKTLRESNDETPVLFLTARDSVQDRVDGLQQGADDYLVKPFALEELLARVDALTRRRYNQRCTRIEVGDLVLDRVKKTVTRTGEDIPLQPRQFVLLEYLMMRHGQVVSRTEIEEHVYDCLENHASNVIDVGVCSLRKCIETGPQCKPLIHTRRGHGYIIEER